MHQDTGPGRSPLHHPDDAGVTPILVGRVGALAPRPQLWGDHLGCPGDLLGDLVLEGAGRCWGAKEIGEGVAGWIPRIQVVSEHLAHLLLGHGLGVLVGGGWIGHDGAIPGYEAEAYAKTGVGSLVVLVNESTLDFAVLPIAIAVRNRTFGVQ